MKKTIQNKLTAIFTEAKMEFSPACAEIGAKMHDTKNRFVDIVHAFGSLKNEEDAVASVVAGVLEISGETPNYLDYAQNAKEAGVSIDGYVNGWNRAIKTMEAAGYDVTPCKSSRRKSALISANDKCHTLKQIWSGVPNDKRKKKTLQQLVNSLVKQHGRNAVMQCIENAG